MSTSAELRALLQQRIVQLLALAVLLAIVAGHSLQLKFCVLDLDIWWHLKVGDWIVEHVAVPHIGILSRTAASSPLGRLQLGIRSPSLLRLSLVRPRRHRHLRSPSHSRRCLQHLLDGSSPLGQFLAILSHRRHRLLGISLLHHAAPRLLLDDVLHHRPRASARGQPYRPHPAALLAPSFILVVGQSPHPIHLRTFSGWTLRRREHSAARRRILENHS